MDRDTSVALAGSGLNQSQQWYVKLHWQDVAKFARGGRTREEFLLALARRDPEDLGGGLLRRWRRRKFGGCVANDSGGIILCKKTAVGPHLLCRLHLDESPEQGMTRGSQQASDVFRSPSFREASREYLVVEDASWECDE